MTASTSDDRPAVDKPKEADTQWEKKLTQAAQAREISQAMRKGKPKSFRKAVGKAK